MIPAQAVEAAAEVMQAKDAREGFGEYPLWEYTEDVTAILEAAAPHMLAGLRADLVKLAQEFEQADGGTLAYTVIVDRFGMRKNAHDQIMYILDDHATTRGEK